MFSLAFLFGLPAMILVVSNILIAGNGFVLRGEMGGAIVDFIVSRNLGDVASVVGLVVAIFGFFITIVNVVRSRKAAEEAKLAADQVRADIERFDTVSALSAALRVIEEIKTLLRERAWAILPFKCAELRKMLVEIKSGNPHFSNDQLALLQGTIQQLSGMEHKLDRHMNMSRAKEPNVPDWNKVLSKLEDDLGQMLAEIRSSIGR